MVERGSLETVVGARLPRVQFPVCPPPQFIILVTVISGVIPAYYQGFTTAFFDLRSASSCKLAIILAKPQPVNYRGCVSLFFGIDREFNGELFFFDVLKR